MRRIGFVAVLFASVLAFGAPSARAASHDIHIVNGAPQPQQLTVANGDTVFFVNDDNVAHAIFAGGQQRGDTIMPNQTGGPYGPFSGPGGQFAYTIDSNTGPGGVIIVEGGSPPPTTSRSTGTTSPPTTAPPTTATSTTATTASSTTSTSASTSTTTTTTAPTTTSASSSSSSSDGGNDSQNGIRIAGVALIMVGVIGLVVALASQRRRRAGVS